MVEEEKGFKIRDRRLFDEKGELRKEILEEKSQEEKEKKEEFKEEKEKPSITAETAEKKSSKEEEDSHKPPLPPVDFASFIVSLSTNALIYLGEVPNPISNKPEKDIDAARHTIDTIAMLQEKTKGNLTKNEEQLIEEVLFNLRMKFVALVEKK